MCKTILNGNELADDANNTDAVIRKSLVTEYQTLKSKTKV